MSQVKRENIHKISHFATKCIKLSKFFIIATQLINDSRTYSVLCHFLLRNERAGVSVLNK